MRRQLVRLRWTLVGHRTVMLAVLGVCITGLHEYRPDWISEVLYFHLMAVCGFGSALTLRWAIGNLAAAVAKELQAGVPPPAKRPEAP